MFALLKKLRIRLFGLTDSEKQVVALESQVKSLQQTVAGLQVGIPWSPYVSIEATTGDLLVHANVRCAGNIMGSSATVEMIDPAVHLASRTISNLGGNLNVAA